MIVSIDSSLKTFKRLDFHAGLNVLLADTVEDASQGQTRNSAGKTSFVEIVHFLLGANCDKNSIFRTEALIGESFRGTFLVDGATIVIERSGLASSRLFLIEYKEDELLLVRTEKKTERPYVGNADWCRYLGHKMFDLPVSAAGYAEKGAPSFRGLIGYFARRQNSGAFLQPERIAEQQQRAQWQANLSYLLGLDWHIAKEFQDVRDKEKTLKELQKATKEGAFGAVVGTVSELRPKLAIARKKAERTADALSDFRVLDTYKDLSTEASRIRKDMQDLTHNIILKRENLEHLQRSLSTEKPPKHDDVLRMYGAIGRELPDMARRRFEEVAAFHDSIVQNRRAHLENEIRSLVRQIEIDESNLRGHDMRRQSVMKTLEGTGAFEDFVKLQQELALLEAEAASLEGRFKAAEVLEGQSTQLAIDRADLLARLQRDHTARSNVLTDAIVKISDTISALYDDRSGQFRVDATPNGPEFYIHIEGDRGGGIHSMEIFCLDLALFEISKNRINGPGFLIHDSHIFDGVDERQVMKALSLGGAAAGENAQYIVTMNSDIYDRLPFAEDYDPNVAVIPTRLSDAIESGGLFGFKFD